MSEINGSASQPKPPGAADGMKISATIMTSVARIVSDEPDMPLATFMFAIHRALAGMAVVGFGMSHSKLPSDDDLELFVVLYRAHLKDARIMEQQSHGTVN